MRATALVAILFFSLFSVARAQPPAPAAAGDAAFQAYEAGDFARAMREAKGRLSANPSLSLIHI